MDKIDITKLPTLNVEIVGHIDHGKTTLLEKLTGKWTDTHSEELKRGITIKLGYADVIVRKKGKEYNIKKGNPIRYLTFIDAPGHEMLMATMLSGAAIIDAAIIVVAANEGIKSQTREHLIALETKKINKIIIVQNKIDLVDKKEALKNYKEIKEFIKGTIAENAMIIPCSAQQGINIDKILKALCELDIPQRDTESNPIFLIARSFDINKPGTGLSNLKGGVLGGVLKKGALKAGDEIEIKPGLTLKKENKTVYQALKTRVNSLYKGKYKINIAKPGGSLAIETELDPSLTKSDSLAGCIIGKAGKLPEITTRVKLKFNLFKKVFGIDKKTPVDPVKSAEILLLNVNTAITVGNVVKIKDNEVELNLRIPIVPFKGENIGIARNIQGHWRLIGYGEIID